MKRGMLAFLGLLAMILVVSGGETVPSNPPEGRWSVNVIYGVRGTNGVYSWYTCSVRSDLTFMHCTGEQAYGIRPPPTHRITKDQAAELYQAAAKAMNTMEIKPRTNREPGQRPLCSNFAITLDEQTISLRGGNQAPPPVIELIEKFRGIAESLKK